MPIHAGWRFVRGQLGIRRPKSNANAGLAEKRDDIIATLGKKSVAQAWSRG